MDMSSEEMTIEQARAKLGDRVIAAMNGQPTVITRYGRPAAMLVPFVKEPAVITLYETNSDLLVMARGNEAWSMGAPGASPGYLEGTFAQDAQAWAEGDWEPNEGDGQHPTEVDDDLTAVAKWTAEGVQLLVGRDRIGGAAAAYLGED
jgi:prevent-host-death family protein